MIANWIKEWVIPLSAGATFLLAIAAFWAIWQVYHIRKEDRELHFKIKLLDEITRWVRKTRDTIMASLEESLIYQQELKKNLNAQLRNLKAQNRNIEAQRRTTEEVALSSLGKELRELEQEEVILKSQSLNEADLQVRMLSIMKEVTAECDDVTHTAAEFGEVFEGYLQEAGQALKEMIESIDSGKYPESYTFEKYIAPFNRVSLNADALKSLLIKHGSKFKL